MELLKSDAGKVFLNRIRVDYTAFEELKAPDGSDFDLKTLLTFDLFEAELFSHARYKAVGAKVGRALSSLELIRRLSRPEREKG